MTGTCDYILFNLENLYILLFNKIKELNVTGFSDKDKAEYYHRCYKAVDGLWFVKTEQMYDFDSALEIDQEVWNIMPKIQARFLKKKLEAEEGLAALDICFTKKLELDGFKFKTDRQKDGNGIVGISFIISECPWHEILIRSKREHISDKIGGIICSTEYNVWASEFGKDIKFSFSGERICRGDARCILSFNPV